MKPVYEMTLKEFEVLLMSKFPKLIHIIKEINWGPRQRGQGRRRGGKMVTGGMSDAPNGIKKYHRYIPDYDEWKNDELDIQKTDANPELYSIGREIGLNHHEAGKLAILGTWQYHNISIRDAITKGETISDEILYNYHKPIEIHEAL